jgi:hypothetical protein
MIDLRARQEPDRQIAALQDWLAVSDDRRGANGGTGIESITSSGSDKSGRCYTSHDECLDQAKLSAGASGRSAVAPGRS